MANAREPREDLARLVPASAAVAVDDPGGAARLDAKAALQLVFLPGFSTEQASEVSGRGVGMDTHHCCGSDRTWRACGPSTTARSASAVALAVGGSGLIRDRTGRLAA